MNNRITLQFDIRMYHVKRQETNSKEPSRNRQPINYTNVPNSNMNNILTASITLISATYRNERRRASGRVTGAYDGWRVVNHCAALIIHRHDGCATLYIKQ